MTSRSAPLPDAVPTTTGGSPLVRAVQMLERSSAFDQVATLLAHASAPVTRSTAVRGLLQGRGAGHALHPPLTDLPIGLWTSAVFLDLFGGERSRSAAQRLLGAGLLTAVPTAATGFAEWHDTANPERRVGAAHAVLNSVSLGLLGTSYAARARGSHRLGVLTGLAGMSVATASAYLGGHLATARKVGTRDQAFEDDGVGPSLSRPTRPTAAAAGASSDDPVTD